MHDILPNQKWIDVNDCNTLQAVLAKRVAHTPDQTHILFLNTDQSETVITYEKLWNTAHKLAAGLKARGLALGDKVAIMQPSHPDSFMLFLASCWPVAHLSPSILPCGKPDRILHPASSEYLKKCRCPTANYLPAGKTDQPILRSYLPRLKEITTVEKLLHRTQRPPQYMDKHQLALIQYTSGSTNFPKGVALSHQNLLANIRAYGEASRSRQRIFVSVGSRSTMIWSDWHVARSLYYGTPLVLLSPLTFMHHPEMWLQAIHTHRGTISAAPNFAYELCTRKIDVASLEGLDLSCWRLAINGAEPVQAATMHAFTEKFSAAGFRTTAFTPVYGLAESCVGVTALAT